jgi:hypothetical protein
MASISRSAAFSLLATLSAVSITAQVRPEAIPNWATPLYWSSGRPAGAPPASLERTDERERLAIHAESATALPSAPLPFIAVTPCRIVDTRRAADTFGGPALVSAAPRDFPLPTGPCSGIPSNAGAYSLNFTVTNTTGAGDIRVYPQGASVPVVSTLNYVGGQTVANAAIVPAGTDGGISVRADVHGADLIVDINGYYAPIPPGVSGDTVNSVGVSLPACVESGVLAATINVQVRSRIYASGSGSYNPNSTNFQGALVITRLLDSTDTTVLAVSNTRLMNAGLTDVTFVDTGGFLRSGTLYSNPVYVADPGTYILRFYATPSNGSCAGTAQMSGPSLTYLLVAEP